MSPNFSDRQKNYVYYFYLYLLFASRIFVKKNCKKKDEYFFVFVPARRKNFFVYNIVKYIDIGICLLCYSMIVYMISLEKSYIF